MRQYIVRGGATGIQSKEDGERGFKAGYARV